MNLQDRVPLRPRGGHRRARIARTWRAHGGCAAVPENVSLYCLEGYDEMPMGGEDHPGECRRDGVAVYADWGPRGGRRRGRQRAAGVIVTSA